MTDPINILILCTGNSARSILGEALINHLGGGRLRGFSAGSFPKGRVHPGALAVLARNDVAVERAESKSWDVFTADGAPPVAPALAPTVLCLPFHGRIDNRDMARIIAIIAAETTGAPP